MKKAAFIIPGYAESHLRQRGYSKIAKSFEEKGINPIHVDIDWGKKHKERFSDYVKDFIKEWKKDKSNKKYILGFSYGATIAFLASAKNIKPAGIILCSLSPYFTEDQKIMKLNWLKWWRENFTDSDYSFLKIAPKIKCPVYLLVGDKEPDLCILRAKDAKKNLKGSKLITVRDAKHVVGGKEYLEAIKKVISKL